MSHTHRRSRRAVMALAGVVLLVSGYVNSYLFPRSIRLSAVFSPIRQYQLSNLPGSGEFLAISVWLGSGGKRSLDQCRVVAGYLRWPPYHQQSAKSYIF
jgi:hypothetical protein